MKRINKFAEIFSIVTLMMIIVVILAQIILRYVLYYPLSWSDEFATTMQIWMVYIGAYLVLLDNEHSKLEYFTSRLPKKWEPILECFINLICIFFTSSLIYSGLKVTLKTLNSRTPAMEIPMPLIFLSAIVGSLLMLTYLGKNLISGFRWFFCGPHSIKKKVEK